MEKKDAYTQNGNKINNEMPGNTSYKLRLWAYVIVTT